MTQRINCLALDLGAESGRAVIGSFDGERFTLDEVHRFPNGPVRLLRSLHWDVLSLFSGVKAGLMQAWHRSGHNLASLALDTWGVDFGLLDAQGVLLSNPYHYRDSRTDGMLEAAFRRMPREEIFEHTGIQFLQINSLYQLLAMVEQQSPLLSIAQTFLTIPDLFNYWLTGHKVAEYTNATTTQCFNPRTGDWAWPMLEKMGLPTHIFPEVIQPGTILGELWPAIVEETNTRPLAVIAPGCHDTASAVAAVPAQTRHYAYLSSGTWSLMGAELDHPMIDEKSLQYNFTNEGGVCNTIRFLKNIMGLWLVQECRRTWATQGQEFSYDELTRLAEAAPPFVAVIDPDAVEFLAPGDMPARIRDYCARTNQPVPANEGSVIRTALESLALKYRWTMEKLEEILGYRLEVLHIVGGGSKNQLLNQFSADALNRPVITGPVEATAAGNVLMQLLALGHIASLAEGRDLIRRSFQTQTYEPQNPTPWDEAYARFLALPAG